jgi:hypothetical protein
LRRGTRFHAELARAYVKKLTGAATPGRPSSPAPTDESIQPAHEVSCDQAKTLRSEQSNKAAKIRFVNESGATLIIQWIDFKGALKEYAELQPGAELTQETYVTHPWIAAYQEGSCRQLFLPAPGISVARLRPESELSNKATTVKQPPNTKRSDDADPPLKCAKNYKKVEGKCVLLQNCGANAYRSPEGDCYCNKNYRMQNGECVLKQAVKCSRHEVYSSSMGQCIPKAAMCSKNEVYSSSMGQCVPKSLGQ